MRDHRSSADTGTPPRLVVPLITIRVQASQDVRGRTALAVSVECEQLAVVQALVELEHNSALTGGTASPGDDDDDEIDDSEVSTTAAKGAMLFGRGGWELLHCATKLGMADVVKYAAGALPAAALGAFAQVRMWSSGGRRCWPTSLHSCATTLGSRHLNETISLQLSWP